MADQLLVGEGSSHGVVRATALASTSQSGTGSGHCPWSHISDAVRRQGSEAQEGAKL